LKVVVHGRAVSQCEMLDACAARVYQPLGPDKPLAQVAYVFMTEDQARAYLHELWLRGLECWAIVEGREVRLDDSYEPGPPPKPDWVVEVEAREGVGACSRRTFGGRSMGRSARRERAKRARWRRATRRTRRCSPTRRGTSSSRCRWAPRAAREASPKERAGSVEGEETAVVAEERGGNGPSSETEGMEKDVVRPSVSS